MQDILAEVIKAEKEIQGRLEAERERAKQWVERVRRESEEKVINAEKRFKEQFETLVQGAKADARRKASEILEDAARRTEMIERLSDETLTVLVKKHINIVLPEKRHDSKDVKS